MNKEIEDYLLRNGIDTFEKVKKMVIDNNQYNLDSSKFKTMRHIETVRNYLNACVRIILKRAENHDQTKLQSPEVAIFGEHTTNLRTITYGTTEYFEQLNLMKKALAHHYEHNRHHPEFFDDENMGYMNLFDLLEMLVDWKAATLRHNDGDIYKSIEINQNRFHYSDDIKELLYNTMTYLDQEVIPNYADES